VFLAFMFFFMAETPISLSARMYFDQSGIVWLWGAYLTGESISLIIGPIVVPFLVLYFGPIVPAIFACVVLIGVFAFSFLAPWALIPALFIFPWSVRVFNNCLTPMLSRETPVGERDMAFAIRDAFLYGGMTVGLLAASMISGGGNWMGWITALATFALAGASAALWNHNGDTHQMVPRPKSNKLFTSALFMWHLPAGARATLVWFILVNAAMVWNKVCFSFLPISFIREGVDQSAVLLYYGLSSLALPALGILAARVSAAGYRKKIYIFDILFDMVPLAMTWAIHNEVMIILIILFITLKDFVKPVSLAYFFICFSDDHANEVWAANTFFSSLLSVCFPIVATTLFIINSNYLFLSALVFTAVAGSIVILRLPSVPKVGSAH